MSVPSNDLAPHLETAPPAAPDHFSVSWSLPSNLGDGTYPDRYGLNIATDPGFTDMLWSGNVYGGGRTYAATGSSPNTRYYVRVRAHNTDGYSAYSATASFLTPGLPPVAPLRLGQSSRALDGGILGWAAVNPGGADSVTYTVQLATSPAFLTILATYTGLTQTMVAVTGQQPGHTYYARVRATTSNGTSGWSTIISFVTLPVTTYVDQGTFADHLDHLASAVADKLLHLGTYWYGVAPSGADVVPDRTITYVNMSAALSGERTRGPNAPTPSGLGTGQTLTINYPGTYQIDFGFAWDRGASSGKAVQTIWVNNTWRLPADTQKRGRNLNVDLSWEADSSAESVCTHTVHLDQGDVVGFSVYQDTGATVSSTSTSPVKSWARVTMVGF